MKRYISFSLWGNKPIYNIGALKNLEIAKSIYEGWNVIVYYDDTVPCDTILALKHNGALLVKMENDLYGMFWRFQAADLADCEYVIFRDLDSRLTIREKMAVEEWIKSNKYLHVMRDHPYHEIPFGATRRSILGGMWGVKGGVISMKKMISEFVKNKTLSYGSDQTFLTLIYDELKMSMLVHDDLFEGSKFPSNRIGYSFVGERIDEYEKPLANDREILKDYLKRKNYSSLKYILFNRILTCKK